MFSTDKQTLDDLNIFGKHGSDNSILSLFNRCTTRGGAALLEELFHYPLSSMEAINRRSKTIEYLSKEGIAFPFPSTLFDTIEPYLANTDERTRLSHHQQRLRERVSTLIATDTQTAMIQRGIVSLIDLIARVKEFIQTDAVRNAPLLQYMIADIQLLLHEAELDNIDNPRAKLSQVQLASYDAQLRFKHRGIIEKLLAHLYLLDVYISVARVAKEKGFCFPAALGKETLSLRLKGVYHPMVKGAIANEIHADKNSNIIFLTGANMAGKSTLMKSLSLALYLAHMGFAVAAAEMSFSVLDGVYTTINLPDNLGMGASHFYSEVMRVKKMAQEVSAGKKLFILFDELFRGTNVRDAYEGTIAITEGFATKKDALFVLSTHIIEAGTVLKQRCSNIQFIYMPTRMEGAKPIYTYRLREGITDDRHGMVILRNEGVLEILENGPGKAGDRMKSFIADNQTLEDLNLLGKHKPGSIFSIFNKVKTRGGERWLQELFRHPLTDPAAINERSSLFAYFGKREIELPFSSELFERAETYLSGSTSSNSVVAKASVIKKKLTASFLRDEEYDELVQGLVASIEVLKGVKLLFDSLDLPLLREGKEILSDKRLQAIFNEPIPASFHLLQFSAMDALIRGRLYEQMQRVLETIYQLDVYIAVSRVARQRGFGYAKAVEGEGPLFRASALRHPALDSAVANPLSLDASQNLLFLTGANMAGKSTLMKSVGIAVYLSHMGFPVAAGDMVFSVMEGLYCSINVADDLVQGYSHYYAEVLRVKQVAGQVASGKRLLVIFDELFKGTNVKDAYEATLACTRGFAAYRNSLFVISTHIIEVAEELKGKGNIRFSYMPTVMQGHVPRYTYTLTSGVTEDRQGMVIIENEKVLELLEG